jgi:predicted nucleic-acid-binding Zn-ribbon protein
VDPTPNEIDITQINNWMKENWKGSRICPICNNTQWSASESLAELRQFDKGNLVVGGKVYPLLVLICKTCGYTLLFNAIKTGLVKLPENTPPLANTQLKEDKK